MSHTTRWTNAAVDIAANFYTTPCTASNRFTYYPPPTPQAQLEKQLEESTETIDRVLRTLAASPDPLVRKNAQAALGGIGEALAELSKAHDAQTADADARVERAYEAGRKEARDEMGPPVERDIFCACCRRVFCRAIAPEFVTITPRCEGCIREGRL